MNALHRGLPLLSLLLLAGCSAEGGPDGGPGTGGSSGGGDVRGLRDVASVCEETKVGTRLLRRLTRNEADATLRDIFPALATPTSLRPLGWGGVKLSVDQVGPTGFTSNAETLVVGAVTARELLRTAEEIGEHITQPEVFGTVLPCSTAADAACAAEFVRTYGYRLFRRPLTDQEVSRYADYAMSVAGRSDFAQGIKWATVGLIQSPHSFYRSEIGEEQDGTVRLTQFELATELAYVYGGTTPDAELLRKAEAGELSSTEALKAEAVRQLDRTVAIGGAVGKWRALDSFFEEWLEYRRVVGQSRDVAPEFATDLSARMVIETRAFLINLMLGDKGTAQDLLKAPYTIVDGPLATFYGFGDPAAGDGLADPSAFRRAERPAGQGVGILAQSSILATAAHQTYSSPTLRGLFVYSKLLCNPRPKPPLMIPTIEASSAGADPNATTREKFEEFHVKQADACANCHRNFEPYGFMLEHFDETGRYRAEEKGKPINAEATVSVNGAPDTTINGLEELAGLVDETDDIENCISGLMADFYFSGAGATNCLAEEAREKVASGEMSLYDYYIGLVEAPTFTQRVR